MFKNGYLIDFRPGGLLIPDPPRFTLLGSGGEIIAEKTKDCPFIINGKFTYDNLTLEEFLEWERSQSEDLLGAAEDLEDGAN